MQNIIALLVTFALAIIWLRLNDFAAEKGWIESHLSRKIIHMGTGPLYVICWLLFTPAPLSRYLAALVPLAITAQFVLVGTGIIKDEAAVQAMSRSGDRREILRGPLYYGILFILLTVLFWKTSPIGIVALMLMCGGDGLADILGRRYGSSRIPWNSGKTWAGSTGMFVGGWIFAALIVAIYIWADVFSGAWSAYILPITVISLVGTLVESLPLKDVDNLTVTFAAVIVGMIFW